MVARFKSIDADVVGLVHQRRREIGCLSGVAEPATTQETDDVWKPMLETAFWLYPDWGESSNLRDPGTVPFWMRPPKMPAPEPVARDEFDNVPRVYGHQRISIPVVWSVPFPNAPE